MLDRERSESFRMQYEDDIERFIVPCPDNLRVVKATDAGGKPILVSQNFENHQFALPLRSPVYPINIVLANESSSQIETMVVEEADVQNSSFRDRSPTPSSQVQQSDPLWKDVY